MLFVALAMCAGILWIWQAIPSTTRTPWWTLAISAVVLGQLLGDDDCLASLVDRPDGGRSILCIRPGRFGVSWVASQNRSCGLPRGSTALLLRIAGRAPQEADEESIEEEIRTIVSEGHREGLLEEEAREMIEGVIELGDAIVSHIMTPRTDIHMIQVDTPWEEVVESVIESGHTRVPVYGKTRDEIVGILYSKDLLPELAKPADERARPLDRPAAQAAIRAGNESRSMIC